MKQELPERKKYVTKHYRAIERFVMAWVEDKLDGVYNHLTTKDGLTGYYNEGDKLVFKTFLRSNHDSELLAFRKDGKVLANAGRLTLTSSNLESNVKPVQRIFIENKVPMLPFNVFTDAGYNIEKIKIVHTSGEETLRVPKMDFF